MIVYNKLFESKTNNAHSVTMENGTEHIVKFYKPAENKALINEWIGYCLARFMGLPVPKSSLVQLPESFFNQIPNQDGIVFTPHQFSSCFIPGCVNGHEASVKELINQGDLAKVIVFDYWLCNLDRTRKNILLKEEMNHAYQLYVIDQAELFGSNAWTADSILALPESLIKSATHKMMASFVENEHEFKEQIRIVQTIPTQFIEELFTFLPKDWMLTEQEKEAAVNVLNYRRFKVLPKVMNTFIKSIYRK